MSSHQYVTAEEVLALAKAHAADLGELDPLPHELFLGTYREVLDRLEKAGMWMLPAEMPEWRERPVWLILMWGTFQTSPRSSSREPTVRGSGILYLLVDAAEGWELGNGLRIEGSAGS